MAKWVFLNDRFIEEENASLHFRDLSFQRGYGIFDFFRLGGHSPLFLDDHLSRFYSSAKGMHLAIPYSKAEMKAFIETLIEKNNLPDTGIRLSLTGGCSEDGFTLAKPNFLMSQHSFFPPTHEQRKTGIKLFTHNFQRQLPHIKSIDYLMAIWLQPLRLEKKADDILYHQNNIITECPRSNFFIVTTENQIITPAENILKGITRQKAIDIAKKNYEVVERNVSMEEIATAKEAFITSTTKRILPVRQIDDVVFQGSAVSLQLYEALEAEFAC